MAGIWGWHEEHNPSSHPLPLRRPTRSLQPPHCLEQGLAAAHLLWDRLEEGHKGTLTRSPTTLGTQGSLLQLQDLLLCAWAG